MDNEVEVTVCDICGDAGRKRDNLLAICCKCPNGAEHTYCMRVMRKTLPKGDWMCEECTMRSECQESGCPVNLNSLERKTEGISISSTSHLSAEKIGVPSEAQPMKKERVVRTSGESSKSSQPCYNCLLPRDLSCQNFKNGKAKSMKDIYSELQISFGSQEKAKAPHARGDKRRAGTLAVEIDGKKRAFETRAISPKASKPSDRALRIMDPSLKKLGKEKVEASIPVCSVRQSSYGSQETPKLLARLGEESQKFDSQTEIATHDKCALLKSGSCKTAGIKFKGQLAEGGCLPKHNVERNLAFHDIGKRENIGLLSKSESFNSAEKSNTTCSEVILANTCCPLVFKDLNSAEAETAKGNHVSVLRNPATGLLATESDEYSKFEAAILSKNSIIPKPDYTWLGKFQIHVSEGIELICDGIQAHLSTHASQKASEVMDKLPDVIVLEELPRLRMWPAQFVESGATEKNIALYFFAKDLKSYGTYYKGLLECMTKKDLALKGNINGFELLIFPSNILPEKSQRWNQFLFLWGVFRGRKINNSAYTPLSEFQKRENRDTVRIREFDLNAYPEDEDEDENDMAGVHEVSELDSINIGSSRDSFFPGGASYNSGHSDSVKPLDAEERMPKPVTDSDLSLRPESAIGNVSDKSYKDVKGKTPKQENYDADDVELLHWRAVETLYLLSMGLTKI